MTRAVYLNLRHGNRTVRRAWPLRTPRRPPRAGEAAGLGVQAPCLVVERARFALLSVTTLVLFLLMIFLSIPRGFSKLEGVLLYSHRKWRLNFLTRMNPASVLTGFSLPIYKYGY